MCLYGPLDPTGLGHASSPLDTYPIPSKRGYYGVQNGSLLGVPNHGSRGPDTQIRGTPDLYRSSYRITVDPIEPPKHWFRLFRGWGPNPRIGRYSGNTRISVPNDAQRIRGEIPDPRDPPKRGPFGPPKVVQNHCRTGILGLYP